MNSKGRTLYDVASVLRSKNSGPFALTLDVLFPDQEIYETVKQKNILTRETVARLYGVPIGNVSQPVYFDSALGVKVTLARSISSGSPLDTDVYGAQQHAPLMSLIV